MKNTTPEKLSPGSGRVHRPSFEPLARKYAEQTALPMEPHLIAAKELVETGLVAV